MDVTEPTMIKCDNGSEFISNTFTGSVKEKGSDVRLVVVKDYHRLGIVDRFCRTLGEQINKNQTMFNTTKYIHVLPKIISKYNSS